MTHTQPAYCATWQLLSELSFYEEGPPPLSGTYIISVADGTASFQITWRADTGDEHSISFGGPLDGQPHMIEHPPGAAAAYTEIDEQTLDSAVFVNDVEVAYARRRVSNDGQLLAVLQTARRPDGSTYRNTQVYRRIDEDEQAAEHGRRPTTE